MDFCKYIDSFCIWYSRNNLLLVDQEPRNWTEAAGGASQKRGSRRDPVCWAAGDRTGGGQRVHISPCLFLHAPLHPQTSESDSLSMP